MQMQYWTNHGHAQSGNRCPKIFVSSFQFLAMHAVWWSKYNSWLMHMQWAVYSADRDSVHSLLLLKQRLLFCKWNILNTTSNKSSAIANTQRSAHLMDMILCKPQTTIAGSVNVSYCWVSYVLLNSQCQHTHAHTHTPHQRPPIWKNSPLHSLSKHAA